eukprot:14145096-Alexandrium_andersonii.AAC.1
MFRTVGPAGTAASSVWNVGPVSVSACVLLGDVLASTYGCLGPAPPGSKTSGEFATQSWVRTRSQH